MKKKEEQRLDILSSIDEDIIEKHSMKRYRLLERHRQRQRQKMMRLRLLAVAACLVLLVAACSVVFLPNLFSHTPTVPVTSTVPGIVDPPNNRQVPVYQGITISGENPSQVTHTVSLSVSMLGADYTIEKNPIQMLSKDSVQIEGIDEEIYHATPNQDIYITIHLSNPDNYEILSFTLNGKGYSSYMFEDGSDMETLILKYNVGAIEGIYEYTVDAIKYIDGKEIKDAVMAGDRTVRCIVFDDELPSATFADERVGFDTLSLSVTLKDELGLIALCGGKAVFVLESGGEEIWQKELSPQEESITIDTLSPDTAYEYAVYATYDKMDGNGVTKVLLAGQAIRTQAALKIENLVVTKDSVSFTYAWNPDFENKVIKAATLYRDKEKVKELATDVTSVDGLLSGRDYSIVLSYEIGAGSENISIDFTTKAKTVPSVTLTAGEATQSALSFSLLYTDPENVGRISKIELLRGNDAPIVAANTDVLVFENLLSNNEYTLRVTVVCDLNDGEGERELHESLTLCTKAKKEPFVSFGDVVCGNDTLSGQYTLKDSDGTLISKTVELYQGESLVQTLSSDGDFVFDNLTASTEYIVKVSYIYDLHDGQGERESGERLILRTKEMIAPMLIIRKLSSAKYSLSFQCEWIDPDGVLLDKTVTLYQDGMVIETSKNDGEIVFDGLTDYTDYTAVVSYSYDLHDGKGVKTDETSRSIKTKPQVDITSLEMRNASTVYQGDTILLQATLDNLHSAKVSALIINGKSYAASEASGENTAWVEITADTVGDACFVVEGVIVTLDGTSYTVESDRRASAELFINGKIEFVGWDFVNENCEPIPVLIPGEKTYLRLTLDNPTDYAIETLELNQPGDKTLTGSDLIQLDRNTYLCPVVFVLKDEFDPATPERYEGVITVPYGECYDAFFELYTLSYSNEFLSDTLRIDDKPNLVFVLKSTEIGYISSVEALSQMEEGIRYELTCDIDLAGVSWSSIPFRGVLNGKGFAIKNLSFVGRINDASNPENLGLFSTAMGWIYDLRLENLLTNVSLDEKPLCYGGIAAQALSLTLQNCTVDAASSITVTVEDHGYIGALVGIDSQNCVIQNCQNYATITVIDLSADDTTYVGGIVGYLYGSVSACTNIAKISGDGNTTCGEIVGYRTS